MNQNAKKLLIIAISIFLCMIFIDETGVAVTLPRIQLDLGMSSLGIQWAMNAMFLPLSVLILFAGKLSDHLGHRKTFTLGMVIFLIASLLCTIAPTGALLIAGRFLQGVGASFLLATYAVLISMLFEPNERGRALGACASIASIFLATGPFIAGAMTDYLSWRLIFAANLPLGLICLWMVYRAVPADAAMGERKAFDVSGLFLFVVGFSALVFALMEGVVFGWASSTIIALFVVFIVFLPIFIKVELKHTNPLIDLRLFKNKTFLSANIILLCTQIVVMTLTYWAIWLQESLGFSSITAGLALLPAGLPILIMARVGGHWLDHHGPRLPIGVGSIIVFVGMVFLALTAPLQNYWLAAIGFLAYGIGAPLIISPAIGAVLGSVAPEVRGMAAGTLNTMRQLGATLCFAIVGAVITNYVETKNQIIPAVSSSAHIYTMGFTYGMAVAAFFALVSIVFAYTLLGKTQN